MKALRFDHFGGPEVLEVVDVERPKAQRFEVVVAVRAASINPSDIVNVAGKMAGTTLPRIPGRDFAGVVIDGPEALVGREVWGAGGDIGFTRDGSHAEFIVVPEDGVARKPPHLSFEEAAAVGVNFVTAWTGLFDAAHLAAGETVLVTGAAGGVGSSVVQLARWMGAATIGVDQVDQSLLSPHLQADVLLGTSGGMLEGVLRATNGRGADVVYDTVGAPLFETNLAALAPDGRYVLISSPGERRASFDLLDFYHKRIALFGVDSRSLDTRACAIKLERLRSGFESSRLHPPRIAERFQLADGVNAYIAAKSGVQGKVVITASTN